MLIQFWQFLKFNFSEQKKKKYLLKTLARLNSEKPIIGVTLLPILKFLRTHISVRIHQLEIHYNSIQSAFSRHSVVFLSKYFYFEIYVILPFFSCLLYLH